MPDTSSTTTFRADISSLRAEMQAASRAVKVANSEFKAATAGMDDWGASADGLEAKIKQLNAVLAAQNKQVDLAAQELSKCEAEYGEKPLGEFVREIVGLDMNAAKEAFSEFLNDVSLDEKQIYFVNQIVEYIVHNGMLKDFSVFQEPPFTDKGSVVTIFGEQMIVWQKIVQVINQINANAVAA